MYHNKAYSQSIFQIQCRLSHSWVTWLKNVTTIVNSFKTRASANISAIISIIVKFSFVIYHCFVLTCIQFYLFCICLYFFKPSRCKLQAVYSENVSILIKGLTKKKNVKCNKDHHVKNHSSKQVKEVSVDSTC